MSFNEFSDHLPVALNSLSNLETFDVSHNQLIGIVSEHNHFAKLTGLISAKHVFKLFLLMLNVSSDWFPPFDLDMGSVKVGPQFPAWHLGLV